MTVRLVVLRTETRHDHIRPETANLPDDIGKNFVAIPNPQSFLRAFRKAEINRAGEELATAIQLSRREEFLGAGDAELFVEFGTEDVLAAITTSH